MKIEIFDDSMIKIFVNSNYLKNVDFNSKEEIVLTVKEVIMKYKMRLNLNGFYKVKVFVKEEIGFFIEIIKLDDNMYSDIVDLKVIVYLEQKVYFKTSDYNILPSKTKIYYLDNYFYCDVDDLLNIYSVVEFGEYVYGKTIDLIRSRSIIV
ncbi:MAG: hypothetical protein E7160_03420 [Firmicutes bacterium]|nr:hypothetical protein [Bacillota bacterium]